MRTRTLGVTELQISEIGLGCARIGGIFQGAQGAFVDLLHAATDAGVTFFDTADMYSQGESELLIGRAFRGRRDRVVIASKAGYLLPAQRRLVAKLKPLLRPLIRRLKLRRDRLPAAVRGSITQNFSTPYLKKAVEGSLRRLQTDYLDLLQLHSPPADVVARGEWLGALESLKQQGKIRHYGISVDTIEAGMAALEYDGVATLQFAFNILEPGATEVLLPKLRARRVAGIARECLANGLLIKPLESLDLASYTHSEAERARRVEQITKLRDEAKNRGSSVERMALDFVRQTEGVAVTLIGARNVDQLNGVLRHL
jgi:aryl-alcohol dehydrogenase-like predicted oxidoreductase